MNIAPGQRYSVGLSIYSVERLDGPDPAYPIRLACEYRDPTSMHGVVTDVEATKTAGMDVELAWFDRRDVHLIGDVK